MDIRSELFMVWDDGRYMHEGVNAFVCSLYNSTAQIDKVEVTEDETETSPYWAWWDNTDQRFMFIWNHKGLVEMCFPYGCKAEEDRGRGKLCQANIRKIETVREAKNK